MSKYSSKNNAFQLGLALFTLFGLSMGIILTTGNAPLNFFSFAQIQTNYNTKGSPCKPGSNTCYPLKCTFTEASYSCQNDTDYVITYCTGGNTIKVCNNNGDCKTKERCKYGCTQNHPASCKAEKGYSVCRRGSVYWCTEKTGQCKLDVICGAGCKEVTGKDGTKYAICGS